MMKLDLGCLERSAPRAQVEAGAADAGAWGAPVDKFELPAVQDVSGVVHVVQQPDSPDMML